MIVPKKINIFHPKPLPEKKKKTIKQPIPKTIDFWVNAKKNISKEDMDEILKSHVNTSKLEYVFMRNFLDKLGLKYIHQFITPAKFVYDFAILTQDGTQIDALIECDGDFWHNNPKTNSNKILYENQKKQMQRDKAKNNWAAINGFILIRFWEYDINNNPKKVLEELKKRFYTKFDKK
jgi:very-short-patch-repair endonuclease